MKALTKVLYILFLSILILNGCSKTNNVDVEKVNNSTNTPKLNSQATDMARELEKNEYYYEPNESIIEGILITRLYYGRPNYGENPETDEKEYPFILQLDNPIKIFPQEGDTENTTIEDIKEVQIASMNDDTLNILKKSKNKRIKIQGTFFSSFTGHHHTDVLLAATKILDVDGK